MPNEQYEDYDEDELDEDELDAKDNIDDSIIPVYKPEDTFSPHYKEVIYRQPGIPDNCSTIGEREEFEKQRYFERQEAEYEKKLRDREYVKLQRERIQKEQDEAEEFRKEQNYERYGQYEAPEGTAEPEEEPEETISDTQTIEDPLLAQIKNRSNAYENIKDPYAIKKNNNNLRDE